MIIIYHPDLPGVDVLIRFRRSDRIRPVINNIVKGGKQDEEGDKFIAAAI